MTLVQDLYKMIVMANYQDVIGNDVGAIIYGFEIQVHIKLEKILQLT